MKKYLLAVLIVLTAIAMPAAAYKEPHLRPFVEDDCRGLDFGLNVCQIET